MADGRNTFEFTPDPEKLENQELQFATFAEGIIEELEQESLVEMIRHESENQLAELEKDLESVREDRLRLSERVGEVKQRRNDLGKHAGDLAMRQMQMKQEMSNLEAQNGAQIQSITAIQNQLADLGDVRKQLTEARSKESKGIDAKLLAKVVSSSEKDPDSNIMFCLDNIARFLDENEKSNFQAVRTKYFSDHEAFAEQLRKYDQRALGKDFCESLMKDITGGSSEGGKVAKALTDPENLQRYVDYYPLFKTLSKMVYLTVTVRKEVNFKRKISTSKAQSDKLLSKLGLQRQMVAALDAHHAVRGEADRIFREEEKFLTEKLEKAEKQISIYEAKIENFNDEFFKDLPGVQQEGAEAEEE